MPARRPCPPAPGLLEAYAAQFDPVFNRLAQRHSFRIYLAGLLLPRDRPKTLTALAGAEPITTGSPNLFEIPLERLIEEDPEVIVLGDAGYGVTKEQVAARPGWDVMTAVRTGSVRPADDVLITRPGPRIGDGLRSLALAIHPDLELAE